MGKRRKGTPTKDPTPAEQAPPPREVPDVAPEGGGREGNPVASPDAVTSPGAPPADSPPPPSKTQAGEETIEGLRRERDEYLDLLQRTKAEYLNYRRRSLRDLDGARTHGVREFVKDLLPVLDHLEHAVRAASEGSASDSLREGVAMIVTELVGLLERRDIARIGETGVPFDPTIHEAVEEVVDDEAPERTVIEILRAGYRQSTHLLRPARVRVSRRSAPPRGDASPPPGGDASPPPEKEAPGTPNDP